MKSFGVRSTMLVPLLGALTLGSAALGLFVYRAVERDQFAIVDGEVTRALAASVGSSARDRPARDTAVDTGSIEPPLQFVVGPDGTVIQRPASSETIDDAQLAQLVAEGGITTVGADPRYRAGSRTRADGTTLVMALSLRSVDASLDSLRRNLLLGGGVLVAVQALIVLAVARRVARPVVRLSGVAHRIAAGDFDTDVGRSEGPRETAALTDDLAAMLARLLAALDERQRAAAGAERARADMERFMADASHELRTPLTALRGYSELHQAGMLDEDGIDRAMVRIGAESDRLSSLVRDLLQLVQPTHRRAAEPVDVAAIVSAVVHDLRAAHPSHEIRHDLDAHAACIVDGDAERLHQAVLNLGANACQHTPAGTEIVITVAQRDGETLVAVIDDGPGIDSGVATTIFQPFTRGETSRSRSSHDGAGLGLAIADRIVGHHGGSIVCSPTPGGGATFTIRLGARRSPNL